MSNPQQQDVYPDDPRADVAPFVPPGLATPWRWVAAREASGRHAAAAASETRLVGVEAVREPAEYTRRAAVFDEVLERFFPDVLHDRDERFDLVVHNERPGAHSTRGRC